MAILFTDGFDSYGTTTGTNLLTRWQFATVPNSFSTTTPYGVGKSHLPVQSGASDTSRIMFTATPTVTVGAAVYPNSLGTSGQYPLFGLLSGTTWMVGLVAMSDGSILVSRMTAQNSATTIGQSAARRIKLNTWYYIEFSVTISDTVGTVEVRVDGETVLSLTNVDTRNGTPTTVDTLYLGANGSGVTNPVLVDDLYISDSITPVGPLRVYTLRPNLDTAQKDWAPLSGANNYAMVADTTIDGDTSYVQASTVGNYDLYDVGNLTPTSATISAVNHLVWARKTDATTRAINLTTKSGATTTDSANTTLSASYVGYNKLYETDPNTGSAWTVSGVNALQIGQKIAI